MEAIIADIHGNLEALEAVLEDMDRLGVERVVCLGDMVGYGPRPAECVRRVRERCQVSLLGNHEDALFRDPEGFNPIAEAALVWTREQMRDKDLLRYIRSLKPSKFEGNKLYVHGSARDPLLEYVRETESYQTFREMIEEIRRSFTLFDVCFAGHNHRAFLGTAEAFIFPHTVMHRFKVKDEKLYVCVGSVGQPRDDEWRACYVTYDGEYVEYHRVAYDVEKTARQIRETGLHPFLADRLFLGQ